MMTLTAKPVVKNKFWIVEQDGEKVATIQSTVDGVVFVHNEQRERFASIKLLGTKYNITFSNAATPEPANEFQVDGFPCDIKPHNALLDISKKLPVFTKTESSKSFFCAGHYLIKFNVGYVQSFCPKLITLNRYEYLGPFASKAEMQAAAKAAKEKK
jgi:hypothetical protein